MSYADLPLHYGQVPPWLARRMALLGGAIVEAIVLQYGKGEVLRRLSDPCWFQALGCVMGMDWHSSGITTSVMGALKKSVNPMSGELGIYICGGKGRHSRETPAELQVIAERTGLPGDLLVRSSKLSAKVDNTAVQDGFQIYLHSFVVSDTGEWAVIQQGMNDASGMARRYHWHSATLPSFTETPHTFIYGQNQGQILNLTDKGATPAKSGLLQMVQEGPDRMLPEIRKLVMPSHHDVRAMDVDLKRLGSVLAVAHERELHDFESLLLLEGVGPRTIQSLTLVSEVIYGTPSRFTDPARFSFAHGGKDGHPFPVPTKVYDETIQVLRSAVDKSKLGQTDKQEAIRKLSVLSEKLEKDFIPNENFQQVIERERNTSWMYGGRTVMGKAKPPAKKDKDDPQLKLF
ncbi:hypothetical protein SAMN04488505_1021063 [Chitinophaga rupis]|uniref:DUF763 domain-containing protein n=1 Tax=Chitinophaga rupis TaxID=573321 RepID=A0A1H7SVN9_9BACT|nr:DUF763 domain-containing protein [Chitinophaga rupis]SEL76722.1 hypothetical protein SAMN04488505_1021063 [Chitinophaga rupis]